MPALPSNTAHPKLYGRQIKPIANFNRQYHQEEERFPLLIVSAGEVWDVRLYTQIKGGDKGTKKAGLGYLGTMSAETYQKFGITPPATSPETPAGANANLPSAFFGSSTSSQLTAGTTGGGTTGGGTTGGTTGGTVGTGGTNFTNQGNNVPNTNNQTAGGTAAADTSWLTGIRDQFAALGNTLGGYVNGLGIPGVNIPTTTPNLNTNGTAAATNQAAGGTGTAAQGGNTPPPSQTNTVLIVAAAAVAGYLIYRRLK